MFSYTGGQTVGSGTYWDMMSGTRVDFEKEGTLPGGNGAKYLKASSGTILLLGPIVGLAYVVFLPIIGIGTAISLIVQRTLGGIFNLGKHMISFGWRPTEAYLGGKNKKKADSNKPEKASSEK